MVVQEPTIRMRQCMRWYGPHDGVGLEDIRQAGVSGIVTALHQIPVGEIWTKAVISERQAAIRKAGMEWEVVESLPVSEDIKQRRGSFERHIENYNISLRNLADCGIYTVTYNFMPILDWVRTDLSHANPDGTRTLRFDKAAFAYFDIHLLKRPGAASEYDTETLERVRDFGNTADKVTIATLRRAVLQGLPGSDENFTESALLNLLEQYGPIPKEVMRQNLVAFLKAVVPTARDCGVRLAIHPDDPPFPLLGLPRVVSSGEDLDYIFSEVPESENGLCFCTGSLGAGLHNNVPALLDAFGDRVHFLHLRNVYHEQGGNFRESEHLNGHVDMAAVVRRLLKLMQQSGRSLPMRPDHGFLHSLESGTRCYPGYSLMGRLKGLAELRGMEAGIAAGLFQ